MQKSTPKGLNTPIRIEILDTMDCSGFSEEIKNHYKSHILSLMQKLVPGGQKISIAFLSEPEALEIRRLIESRN